MYLTLSHFHLHLRNINYYKIKERQGVKLITHERKAVTSKSEKLVNKSNQKDSVRRGEKEAFLMVVFSLNSAKAMVDGAGLEDRAQTLIINVNYYYHQ